MRTNNEITQYSYPTMVIRRSPIFGDVIVAWKKLDAIDYHIWKEDPEMISPVGSVRVQTLGL